MSLLITWIITTTVFFGVRYGLSFASMTIPIEVLPLIVLAEYLLVAFTSVKEWQRVAVYRFGRLETIAGPGLVFVEPFTCTMGSPWSLTDFVSNNNVESIQTHDNVPIKFTLVMTYAVVDVRKAIVNVADLSKSLASRALSVCASFVSNTELDIVLHEHDGITEKILKQLQVIGSNWGVQVKAIEIRDVTITDTSLCEAIAMKARAEKEGSAELVRAEKQHQISIALSAAAESLTESGWKLKHIEMLLEMARNSETNTVMVPSEALSRLSIPLPTGKG